MNSYKKYSALNPRERRALDIKFYVPFSRKTSSITIKAYNLLEDVPLMWYEVILSLVPINLTAPRTERT